MLRNRSRWMTLVLASSGFLMASSCSVADAVIETIRLAFNIVDVWV